MCALSYQVKKGPLFKTYKSHSKFKMLTKP